MNSEERYQAQMEVERGERAMAVWEALVKPFFDHKRDALIDLYEKTTDADMMVEINMQLRALRALKAELDNYIDSGKMAQISLDRAENRINEH